eukprot:348299-Prymnesium_polylepis.1
MCFAPSFLRSPGGCRYAHPGIKTAPESNAPCNAHLDLHGLQPSQVSALTCGEAPFSSVRE